VSPAGQEGHKGERVTRGKDEGRLWGKGTRRLDDQEPSLPPKRQIKSRDGERKERRNFLGTVENFQRFVYQNKPNNLRSRQGEEKGTYDAQVTRWGKNRGGGGKTEGKTKRGAWRDEGRVKPGGEKSPRGFGEKPKRERGIHELVTKREGGAKGGHGPEYLGRAPPLTGRN